MGCEWMPEGMQTSVLVEFMKTLGEESGERENKSRGEIEHLRKSVITSLPFFDFSRE